VKAVEEEMNRQRYMVWLTLSAPDEDELAISDAKMKVQDLHACLRGAEKGHDLYEIVICSDEWSVRLTPHENSFAFTPGLHEQLSKIVGNENIQTHPL
jgi:hypothetical protein